MRYSLTGATTAKGSATINAPVGDNPDPDLKQKCATYAKGFESDIGLGVDIPTKDGTKLQTDLYVLHYRGPGTYRLDKNDLRDVIQFTVQAGGGGYQLLDDAGDVTGADVITVNPDFSVHIGFTDLPTSGSVNGHSAAKISGSIDWTCVDPQN